MYSPPCTHYTINTHTAEPICCWHAPSGVSQLKGYLHFRGDLYEGLRLLCTWYTIYTHCHFVQDERLVLNSKASTTTGQRSQVVTTTDPKTKLLPINNANHNGNDVRSYGSLQSRTDDVLYRDAYKRQLDDDAPDSQPLCINEPFVSFYTCKTVVHQGT